MAHSNTMKRLRSNSDEETESIFTPDNFAKFIVIESTDENKPITSLSPFVIEKQLESLIGIPKSVKKLRNKTLLVETTKKAQSEHLLKVKSFFNVPVIVSEHKTLNSSKGIIRDPALKGESEHEILDYLKEQGVIAVKRFKIKKGETQIETNTLLLTFNSDTLPKTLKIFYRLIPVDIYIPNPLRCFQCQRFGHHESSCTVERPGCQKCTSNDPNHLYGDRCENAPKCINCGKDHLSRSPECEVWKKEKEIIKLKVTQKLTYPEAKKLFEQRPDITYAKILSARVETKTVSTQYNEKDTTLSASSKIIIAKPNKTNPPNSNTKSSQLSQSKPVSRSQSTSRSHNSRTEKSPSAKDKKKQNSNRNGKGSTDPIKLANRYDNLDDMEMEVSSQSSRSSRK